jgi:carboxypeptidase T
LKIQIYSAAIFASAVAFSHTPSASAHGMIVPGWSAEGTSPQTRQYSDVKQFIQDLAQQYPQTTTVVEIGPSDSGDTILALAIASPTSRASADTVKNIVVGTHHGNEYGATEVTMAFAESVAANPIPGQLLYVIPVLNVSGYNARDRYEPSTDGASHDPNRDYPGPCGTEGPFLLKSTHALADFIEREQIVASATLHTYYPAVVYPWGIPTQDLSTPYDDAFKQLCQAATVESGYQVGNSTEVIYAAAGAYEDYAFWKLGAWSLLFELGDTHTPSDAEVQQMIQVNVPGMRRMMEQAPRQRAEKHDFTGQCDSSRLRRDLHNE